jgi:hypothetical protein
LDKCRAAAQAEGVPFFAFTVLREPVAHALSFFNFFHVAVKPTANWNPFRAHMEPTESNFLATFQGNRQCHMLDRDAEALFKSPLVALKDPHDPIILRQRAIINDGDSDESHYFQKCRVNAVRRALFESLDWVGTTDQLSKSTLPLITSILLSDPEVGSIHESSKVFTEDPRYNEYTGLHRDDLSTAALERVFFETQWDRQLYKEAQAMFQFKYPLTNV